MFSLSQKRIYYNRDKQHVPRTLLCIQIHLKTLGRLSIELNVLKIIKIQFKTTK